MHAGKVHLGSFKAHLLHLYLGVTVIDQAVLVHLEGIDYWNVSTFVRCYHYYSTTLVLSDSLRNHKGVACMRLY